MPPQMEDKQTLFCYKGCMSLVVVNDHWLFREIENSECVVSWVLWSSIWFMGEHYKS